MKNQEELFYSIGDNILNADRGNLFGKPCYKFNKKAFVCFFQDQMVFKLSYDIHTEALGLKDSKLFDPSGKNRPMKEWVQVSFEHKSKWARYAEFAKEYITRK